MNVMNHQQAEREAVLLQAHREELVERIARPCAQMGPPSRSRGFTCTAASRLWNYFMV